METKKEIPQSTRWACQAHERGLCVDCGKPAGTRPDGKAYRRCVKCQEKHRESNRRYYIKYRGRTTGRARATVEWRFKYDSRGNKRMIPPAVCPECKIRTCADYWYCPWCGAKLDDPNDKEVDTE